MAKIILEKDENEEEVREALYKSYIENHSHSDPVLKEINKRIHDEYLKVQEDLVSDIINRFQKSNQQFYEDVLEKGAMAGTHTPGQRGYPIGTIRNHNGVDWQKVAQGVWRVVKRGAKGVAIGAAMMAGLPVKKQDMSGVKRVVEGDGKVAHNAGKVMAGIPLHKPEPVTSPKVEKPKIVAKPEVSDERAKKVKELQNKQQMEGDAKIHRAVENNALVKQPVSPKKEQQLAEMKAKVEAAFKNNIILDKIINNDPHKLLNSDRTPIADPADGADAQKQAEEKKKRDDRILAEAFAKMAEDQKKKDAEEKIRNEVEDQKAALDPNWDAPNTNNIEDPAQAEAWDRHERFKVKNNILNNLAKEGFTVEYHIKPGQDTLQKFRFLATDKNGKQSMVKSALMNFKWLAHGSFGRKAIKQIAQDVLKNKGLSLTDVNKFNISQREALAHEVDVMLGFGVVPVTKLMKGKIASQQEFLTGYKTWAEHRQDNKANIKNYQNEAQLVAIFHFITGQADGHGNNFMIHPKTGDIKTHDNGLSFTAKDEKIKSNLLIDFALDRASYPNDVMEKIQKIDVPKVTEYINNTGLPKPEKDAFISRLNYARYHAKSIADLYQYTYNNKGKVWSQAGFIPK